jgi:hypothetical protein
VPVLRTRNPVAGAPRFSVEWMLYNARLKLQLCILYSGAIAAKFLTLIIHI